MHEETSMFKSIRTKILAWMLMLALGAQLLVFGVPMAQWRSEQIDYYNAGAAAYQQGDTQSAVELLDRSLNAYQSWQRASWMERFVYPRANTELAARASFLKGMALIRAQQAEPAVAALLLSLRLNPGTGNAYYADDQARLRELSLIAKYNLELLFNQRPDLAYSQGAGRRQSDGDQEGQRVPGQNPGNMPGPGNRDDL
jgi:tetratricopeptide (TPR) repeat protein